MGFHFGLQDDWLFPSLITFISHWSPCLLSSPDWATLKPCWRACLAGNLTMDLTDSDIIYCPVDIFKRKVSRLYSFWVSRKSWRHIIHIISPTCRPCVLMFLIRSCLLDCIIQPKKSRREKEASGTIILSLTWEETESIFCNCSPIKVKCTPMGGDLSTHTMHPTQRDW